MWIAAKVLLAFVALYPVVTAATWMAGGLLFHWLDETDDLDEPDGGWPGVTVLIPAFNEEGVIETCVGAALALDYPTLEVLVLDDGSTDATEAVAREAGGGDERCRVIRDPVNRGKAERLNIGFREARFELVAVTDADTHVHADALKRLVARLTASPILAAVAGAPHVTNRGRLILAMQILEAAAVIGLIRRTQSVAGRVGIVAGVLGLFRRDRVLAVGGYDSRMATEDIELTWKLLLAGWQTAYEPRALVGMQVPSSLRALWAQRTRWARGQGEVLNVHAREIGHLRNHRMWIVSFESLVSLLWVLALVTTLVVAALALAVGEGEDVFGFALGWGIAIAVVATIQVVIALRIEHGYDPTAVRALLIGALYPVVFWLASAAAALRAQTVGLVKGPRKERMVWDIPREPARASEAPGGGAERR
jgi:biofilm PGA synthesis N-glycosyltransferase PgaC